MIDLQTITLEEIQQLDLSELTDEQLKQLEKHTFNNIAKYNSLQMALKIVLNSLYGALGNSGFRYFDVSLASSVTISGQHAIRWIERKLNELLDARTGIKKDRVVLIDTDSVVLDLQDVVEKYCPNEISREQKLEFLDKLGESVFNPYIAASYKELGDYMNAYQYKLKMKRENIINSMVSVAAKSYVMEVYNSEGVQYSLENPYMKIMGLVLVKSSMPKVIRHALKDALPIMLHGKERDIQNYNKKIEDQFKNFSVEQIAFPRGITELAKFDKKIVQERIQSGTIENDAKIQDKLDSPSELYIKGTPIHVRGSLIYNDLIDKHGLGQSRRKIVDGDKVKYVYLKTPNPIQEDCIAFQDGLPVEFGLHEYVDYNKMFEKAYMQSITKMIEPLKWDPVKVGYLEDLFAM